MWIQMAPNASLRCKKCSRKVDLGRFEVLTSVPAVEARKINFSCRCGANLNEQVLQDLPRVAGPFQLTAQPEGVGHGV